MELTGWSNSPKDGGRSGKDTMYFSYSNKHHGKAKAMEMTGLWGQRVALSQGWPWQTLLKPEPLQHCDFMAHTVRAVRKVYLTVLGCSKDGLCLCLKVKRRKETGETLGQIWNMRWLNAMVSKLVMPLPLFLGLGACSCLCRPPCSPANPDATFPLHFYQRPCKSQSEHHL